MPDNYFGDDLATKLFHNYLLDNSQNFCFDYAGLMFNPVEVRDWVAISCKTKLISPNEKIDSCMFPSLVAELEEFFKFKNYCIKLLAIGTKKQLSEGNPDKDKAVNRIYMRFGMKKYQGVDYEK